MSVRRGLVPSDGFTMISNEWLRDPRLSARAKGLLAYILSHESGYVLTVEQMRRQMTDGETSIRAGLTELEEHGYLSKIRSRDELGRLGAYEWTIGEVPAQDQAAPSSLDEQGRATTPLKKTTPEKTKREPSASPRGARLPEGWQPSEASLAKILSWVPGGRWSEHSRTFVQRQHEVFTDHWTAAAGATASKKDWDAAWRNWMRRAFGRDYKPNGSPTSSGPQQFKIPEEVREERAEKRQTQAQVADEIRRQDPSVTIKAALALAKEVLEQRGGNALSTSALTGYIDAEIVPDSTGPQEVTGS